MLIRCCSLTTLPLPFALSFASLDTHGNGIAESSWLTDYYTTVAGTGYAMIMTRVRCLFVLEFFCFFFIQGIGSWSASWASRVDFVWVSVCVSSVVGCCSYIWGWCIHVALYASCMYPHLLCNVDVMISTLQKRFNMRFYPWWDLRVP